MKWNKKSYYEKRTTRKKIGLGKMRKLLDLFIRILGSMLAIQFINMVLLHLQMECFVGLNGYTLAVAAVLGLPGILGLYVMAYLM